MTTQEVFTKITNEHKWYAGYCSKQYACILKKRFKNGELTQQKIKEMFGHFGYTMNEVWVN